MFQCWQCKRTESEVSRLMICIECKVAKYCCKQCQRDDWKMSHKLIHKGHKEAADAIRMRRQMGRR